MLEPYQPGKIPVLMVHGLWSSPITWMEMFNDLRGRPADSRSLPVLVLPVSHRAAVLAQRRSTCVAIWPKPARSSIPSGGSRRSTRWCWSATAWAAWCRTCRRSTAATTFGTSSATSRFSSSRRRTIPGRTWPTRSSFARIRRSRRVITIGTPFRGSTMANSTTRWLGSKLIKLPQMIISHRQQLHKDNPDLFREPANLIDVNTSIDSLAPDSPILPVMLAARRPPWVHYHNIVGRVPDQGLLERMTGGSDGDGVVSTDERSLRRRRVRSRRQCGALRDPSASARACWKSIEFCWRTWPKSTRGRRATWSVCPIRRRRPAYRRSIAAPANAAGRRSSISRSDAPARYVACRPSRLRRQRSRRISMGRPCPDLRPCGARSRGCSDGRHVLRVLASDAHWTVSQSRRSPQLSSDSQSDRS